MAPQQRRRAATISWQAVVWVLLLQTGWDAAGLLVGGDAVYAAPGYDVLRRMTPWGMRGYGPVLALLFVLAVYAYGRFGSGHGYGRMLHLCLGLLAGWYVLWMVGTTASWVVHEQVLAWPGPARLGALAVFFVLAARAVPHRAAPTRRGGG